MKTRSLAAVLVLVGASAFCDGLAGVWKVVERKTYTAIIEIAPMEPATWYVDDKAIRLEVPFEHFAGNSKTIPYSLDGGTFTYEAADGSEVSLPFLLVGGYTFLLYLPGQGLTRPILIALRYDS